MRFLVGQKLNGVSTALGATMGNAHCVWIEDNLRIGPEGEVVIFDFDGVTETNGSYLRATAFKLLLSGRSTIRPEALLVDNGIRPLDVYVVFANVTPPIQTEIAEFFVGRRHPILVGTRWNGDLLEEARLEGTLDPALTQTLDLVHQTGRVSAPGLFQRFPDRGIQVTAWNNRLNDLCELRLLRRTRKGRAWEYEGLAKGVTYGCSIY